MTRRAPSRRKLAAADAAPWLVDDELWALVEPLLPPATKRMGRKRLPDRPALQGILYVLHTGCAWQRLPTELGFGSGFTCWRRLGEWQVAGSWERIQALLADRLAAADQLEWSRVQPPIERPARARRARRSS